MNGLSIDTINLQRAISQGRYGESQHIRIIRLVDLNCDYFPSSSGCFFLYAKSFEEKISGLWVAPYCARNATL